MGGRELLAFNVRTIRTRQGISQERLSIDADVARGYLSQLEREKVNPTLDVLERLARALEVPVGALLAEPEPGAIKPPPLANGRKRGGRS